MIIIDGQQSNIKLDSFENLEQVLVSIMKEDCLRNRVITDVMVNQELFSEIYPHQAEDISAGEVRSLEIISMPTAEMATNITDELYKVIRLMHEGARHVSDLFRRADDAEALEVYQDLIDVTRDFLNIIGALREEFGMKSNALFNEAMEEWSGLFSEMIEVLENEDWILLADLLEYEFIPAAARWTKAIAALREDILGSSEKD